MKTAFVTATILLAVSAVPPAHGQSAKKNTNQAAKNCWVQTDPSRMTGYYAACPADKNAQVTVPRGRPASGNNPVPAMPSESSRDSGGGY